jgi:hypothetical protein
MLMGEEKIVTMKRKPYLLHFWEDGNPSSEMTHKISVGNLLLPSINKETDKNNDKTVKNIEQEIISIRDTNDNCVEVH